jgi:hypothetical protein
MGLDFFAAILKASNDKNRLATSLKLWPASVNKDIELTIRPPIISAITKAMFR